MKSRGREVHWKFPEGRRSRLLKRIAFASVLPTVDGMAESNRRGEKRFGNRRAWGMVLLGTALLALSNRYLPTRSDDLALPLLGFGFVVAAVLARVPSLVIPGGVLFGAGLSFWAPGFFALGAGTHSGQALSLGCLSLGFLLITLLSSIFFRLRILWPLWPSAFIGLAAGLRLLGSGWQNHLWRLLPYWPFALLAIALWLLLYRRGK